MVLQADFDPTQNVQFSHISELTTNLGSQAQNQMSSHQPFLLVPSNRSLRYEGIRAQNNLLDNEAEARDSCLLPHKHTT